MIDVWMIWIIAGVICMIIEIFTPTFFFMSFGIGAIVTGILSLLIKNVPIQFLLFAIITFLVFINLRKFNKKFITKTTKETNIFALKNKTGFVTSDIKHNKKGYVKIGGEEWSAISKDGSEINEGEEVVVNSVEGNKLIVSRIVSEKSFIK